MPYKWRIDKDWINTGEVGKVGGYMLDHEYTEEERHRFRMLDGDGEPYYGGVLWFTSDEEDRNPEVYFAPLDDFGTGNAGCAYIEYYNYEKDCWEEI